MNVTPLSRRRGAGGEVNVTSPKKVYIQEATRGLIPRLHLQAQV
jgi:hypothetical protein